MDDTVHTVVETVKKLGDTLRDCFEDNFHLVFLWVGQEMVPEVNKIAPPLQFEYDINDYGDVTFILEEFKKRKNVLYKMHLTDGLEDIYKRQTVTEEMKMQVNGQNNIYKAVSYGLDSNVCNYTVKMIKIVNTNNRFMYRFMNIFEIIDQHRVSANPTADVDELDSWANDMKNIVMDGAKPRKRKHKSETDSYSSLKTTSEFYSDDS
jgi:hypothetical protein